MTSHLSEAQFGTLGTLTEGQNFLLPGHDGVLTATKVDTRAGKARVSYRRPRDPQEYGYVGPSLTDVEIR